jgi:hypothetical protein
MLPSKWSGLRAAHRRKRGDGETGKGSHGENGQWALTDLAALHGSPTHSTARL